MRTIALQSVALLFLILLIWSSESCAQTVPAPPAPETNRGTNTPSVQPFLATPPTAMAASSLVSGYDYISPLMSFFSASGQSSSSVELSAYYQSPSRSRLLEVPEMFGDYRRSGPFIELTPLTGLLPKLTTEIPYSGTFSGLKVAENNHALPADRFWFAYNSFNDAIDVATDDSFGLTPTSRSLALDRFVIASEILLDDGATSLELRMPFSSSFRASAIAGMGMDATPYSITGENVGNLNLILKRLLYGNESVALSYGLGLELPTGNSGEITYGDLRVKLDSGAVHLVPFLAMTRRSDRWFGHVFTQLDVATHGDPLRTTLDGVSPLTRVGRINQPPLLSIDIGNGFWLIPKSNEGFGLAVTSELHYTVPLGGDDSFVVADVSGIAGFNTSISPRYEVWNSTVGLQFDFPGDWSVRPAVVLPLRSERAFDVEYILQVNRSF